MSVHQNRIIALTKIATGLIGYGTAGSAFHAPLIATTAGLRLAAIASSRSEQIARDFPDATIAATPQALIESPDITLVVIASPNETHAGLARSALLAGKHVIVDKPFTLEASQADELIELARSRSLVLSVFQNRRWDGDFLTLERTIAEGRLGEIFHYEAHFDRFRPEIKAGWKELPKPGTGILYDLGAHLIDQALYLFGMPEAIAADVVAQRHDAQVPDYFHLVLHYGKRRVVLHASTLVREPGPHFVVHGTGGSFIKYGMDSQEAALRAGERPGSSDWGIDSPEHFATYVDADGNRQSIATVPGRYQDFYKGVADAIADGAAPPVSARDARNTIAVIEAAMRSSREQRTVIIA
jgi:scyllo-inositol 2-dehydrogenase (NADP+)